MKVVLISTPPLYETGKHDMRRSFRGKRKGRKAPRTRVRRGAARAHWAVVVNDQGHAIGRVFRSAAEAERFKKQFARAVASAHPTVRPFMVA